MLWNALAIGSKLFPRPSFICRARTWMSPRRVVQPHHERVDIGGLRALQQTPGGAICAAGEPNVRSRKLVPSRLVSLMVAIESALTGVSGLTWKAISTRHR